MTLAFFVYTGLFLLGLSIGSFLNAWVWRTHECLSVLKGRSVCRGCRQKLAWYDNIPLLSFIMLLGRCRHCREPISHQYPLVEIATACLFVFTAWHHHLPDAGMSAIFIRDILLVVILEFIFIYDFLYQEIITDVLLYPGLLLFGFSIALSWHSWHSMVLGSTVAGGFFLLQYILSKGKWIGGGDVRYGFFMGLILGWPATLVGLLLAYISGAVVSLVQIGYGKKKLAQATPFGTYLTLSTAVIMFYGNQLTQWYFQLLS